MPQKTSWDALRSFLAVFRAGSISAAADELGIPQSSLSEQIARLERELGHRLLERGPGGTRATPRGLELASRIADAVDRMTAATALDPPSDPHGQTVFLGGPAEFLSEYLLPRLPQRLPDGTRMIVRFAAAEPLIEELSAGALDVIVSTIPVRGEDFCAEPTYDEEFELIAHPRWLGRGEHKLHEIPLLAYGPELPIIRRYWRSVFHRRPDTLAPRIIAPDLRTLLRLALDGAGMTVLPSYLVRKHTRSGALVRLHEADIAPLNTLYLATRRLMRPQRPGVTALRDAIGAICREGDH